MRYTVRIELRKPPLGDYEALHRAMELEGFLRYAFDPPKELPTAEYAYVGDGDSQGDVDSVRHLAVNTAATVHPRANVVALVTPVASGLMRRSYHLEPWDEE